MPPQGSAIWVYHATNANWQGADGVNENMGFGAWQGFVDFDSMGDQFRIVWAGNLGSSGIPAGQFRWRVRIGGTYGQSFPNQLIGVDGDVALSQLNPLIPAFGAWSVTEVVTNIWSGRQIVKITGQPVAPASNPFTQRGTLLFVPVF